MGFELGVWLGFVPYFALGVVPSFAPYFVPSFSAIFALVVTTSLVLDF